MPTITQDHVLLLLQTDSNKLLMHWKGPFRFVGRFGQLDYRLDVNGREKLFHINLLKKYNEREMQQAPAITNKSFINSVSSLLCFYRDILHCDEARQAENRGQDRPRAG